MKANEVIERYGLMPHPEGGFYRELHRSNVTIAREALPSGYPGHRAMCTSILFLLRTGERSAWHRVRSEELWLHQSGDPLRLGMGETTETTRDVTLAWRGALQAVVPPGWWQEAEALPGDSGYALVGCVVAPGFDFEDFEMLERSH
ncbi:MAG: cupin domain-containing protein [Planctomycetota bacterium]